MRHRIRHHVNRPVLHLGLFTDQQMLPAAGLFTLAVGWLTAGSGGAVARMVVACLLMLPVAVMVVDNRAGGLVMTQARAWVRWRRGAAMYGPGAGDDTLGYSVVIEDESSASVDRDAPSLDLQTVFAEE